MRYIVAGEPLPQGYGVGIEAGVGAFLADRNQIQFQALKRREWPMPAPDIDGFVIGFRGLRFVGSVSVPLRNIEPPAELGADRRIRRLGGFKLASIDVTIAFDWSGLHRNDADANVVAARRQSVGRNARGRRAPPSS